MYDFPITHKPLQSQGGDHLILIGHVWGSHLVSVGGYFPYQQQHSSSINTCPLVATCSFWSLLSSLQPDGGICSFREEYFVYLLVFSPLYFHNFLRVPKLGKLKKRFFFKKSNIHYLKFHFHYVIQWCLT